MEKNLMKLDPIISKIDSINSVVSKNSEVFQEITKLKESLEAFEKVSDSQSLENLMAFVKHSDTKSLENLVAFEKHSDVKSLENLKSLESIASRLLSIENALAAIETSQKDSPEAQKILVKCEDTVANKSSEKTNEFGENMEQAALRLCTGNDNNPAHGYKEERDVINIQFRIRYFSFNPTADL